ncbi:hypothetical protein, partial [Paraphotobacterium marinum]
MCLQHLLFTLKKVILVLLCSTLLFACGDSNTFKEQDSQSAAQEQPVSNDPEPDADSAPDSDSPNNDPDSDSNGDDNSSVF